MKQLDSNDTDLVGKWLVVEGKVVGDEIEQRITWLTSEILEKIAVSGGGWDTLYRDRNDGRFWERTYPHSSWHGGGPPRLTFITEEEAREKYKV